MAKTSSNAGNSPTTAITTFAHRILRICTKLIQKASKFSKNARFSTRTISRFAKSTSSLAGIFVKKWEKNRTCDKNQLKYLTSQSCTLQLRTSNHSKLVLLESKSRNIFRNTKIAEIQHRELRQPGAGKTEKTSSNGGNSPTTDIQHTTFVHRFLRIHTKVIQKSSTFSKTERLSTTWFSRSRKTSPVCPKYSSEKG